MIAAACENAEKVLADTRKAYGFGTRQGPSMLPTMDKGQAAKIQEQENMLRAAVNDGAGKKRLQFFFSIYQIILFGKKLLFFFFFC